MSDERRLTELANKLIDHAYEECNGDFNQVAYVFVYAFASVVLSLPKATSREILVKAGKLVHTVLWAASAEG